MASSTAITSGAAFDQPARYRVRVQGVLDQSWSAWFDGLELSVQENGETVLAGMIDDQAALHGLLVKLHNLSLPLISVQRESEGAS
jgi:hypothetical protein